MERISTRRVGFSVLAAICLGYVAVLLTWPAPSGTGARSPVPARVVPAPGPPFVHGDPSELVGSVEAQVDCEWIAPPPFEDDRFRSGKLQLKSGSVVLHFDSGTRVACHGPCDVDVSAVGHATWVDGRFRDDERYATEVIVPNDGTVAVSFGPVDENRIDTMLAQDSDSRRYYLNALQKRGRRSLTFHLTRGDYLSIPSESATFAVSRSGRSFSVYLQQGQLDFEPEAAKGDGGEYFGMKLRESHRFKKLRQVTDPFFGIDRFAFHSIPFDPAPFLLLEAGTDIEQRGAPRLPRT